MPCMVPPNRTQSNRRKITQTKGIAHTPDRPGTVYSFHLLLTRNSVVDDPQVTPAAAGCERIGCCLRPRPHLSAFGCVWMKRPPPVEQPQAGAGAIRPG